LCQGCGPWSREGEDGRTGGAGRGFNIESEGRVTGGAKQPNINYFCFLFSDRSRLLQGTVKFADIKFDFF
jgi:hypothetical protein